MLVTDPDVARLSLLGPDSTAEVILVDQCTVPHLLPSGEQVELSWWRSLYSHDSMCAGVSEDRHTLVLYVPARLPTDLLGIDIDAPGIYRWQNLRE